MKRGSFNPVTLRGLLTVVLIIAIGLAGAGFYYAFGSIKEYAAQVNQTVASAHASTAPTTSTTTKALQAALAQQSGVSDTLAKFYASPTDFQASAIQDIDTYAQKSGLDIGDVSFGGSTPAAGTSTPTPGQATADQTTLTVKLNSPVSYTAILKFVSYVQNSLPKMQIQSMTLARVASDTQGKVAIDSLSIKVVTQ